LHYSFAGRKNQFRKGRVSGDNDIALTLSPDEANKYSRISTVTDITAKAIS
jgi:hypothetical protein